MVGLWLNLGRQRLRQVAIVREAVEAARDNLDPSDEYFFALSDYPEEAEAVKFYDLGNRADKRLRNAR